GTSQGRGAGVQRRATGAPLSHSRRGPCHERIHWNNDEQIYRERDQQKRNERVDELADEELAAIDREGDRRKIRRLHKRGNERGQQILDQRGHDRAERGADDDGDREIDDVAAEQELLESFQHESRSSNQRAIFGSSRRPGRGGTQTVVIGRTVSRARRSRRTRLIVGSQTGNCEASYSTTEWRAG